MTESQTGGSLNRRATFRIRHFWKTGPHPSSGGGGGLVGEARTLYHIFMIFSITISISLGILIPSAP